MNIGDKVRLTRNYNSLTADAWTTADSWLAALSIKENVLYEIEETLNATILLRHKRIGVNKKLFVMMEHFEVVIKKCSFVINLNTW